RQLTNSLRFLLDECLPPLLRDNKYFMYPLFWLAYGGRNIAETKEFKSRVQSFSAEPYRDFYANLNSISRLRATDLNEACIKAVLDSLVTGVASLLGVGCGSAHLLQRINARYPGIALQGSDIVPAPAGFAFPHTESDLLALSPQALTCDVVT